MTPLTGQLPTSPSPENTAFVPRPVSARRSVARFSFVRGENAVTRLDDEIEARRRSRARTEVAQRIANVALAAVALFVVSPLLVIVAVLIKLSSRGPIFYMQARVGLDRRQNAARGAEALYDRRIRNLGGRAFMIYKFRSMTVDAEHRSGAVWAAQSDARVTKLGRVLRKTRIDEIPQLINVLKGDMNIVGPRPERPSIFLRLSEQISEYSRRQRARPGITGWAQINQSYDSCLDDVRRKVRYDLEYLERRSLLEDFKIMAMTIPVMVFRRGGW
jgi:lipopolysaccharide/colanic/teichoic acid biosynthesis glycosyltransferase